MAVYSEAAIIAEDVNTICCCSDCKLDLTRPRILPTCGHSFCACCMTKIIKQIEATFVVTCPDCKSETLLQEEDSIDLLNKLMCLFYSCTCLTPYLKESSSDPQENIQLKKLVYAANVKKYRPKTWPSCDHSFLVQSPEVCRHCREKFCSCCMLSHLELLRNEAIYVGFDINKRFENGLSWLHCNVEALQHGIDEQVQYAEQKIVESCRKIEAEFQAAMAARRERLLSQVSEIAKIKHGELQTLLSVVSSGSENYCKLSDQLEELKKESILHCSNDEVAIIHSDALDKDRGAAMLEKLASVKSFGKMVLESAIQEDNLNKVTQQIKKDGSICWIDEKMPLVTPAVNMRLFQAVSDGNLAGLRSILESLPGCSRRQAVEYRYPKCGTLLSRAVDCDHLELVRYLALEEGANLRTLFCDGYGSMPVHLAAEKNQVDMVKFLVDLSPELLTARDSSENTPLCRAAIDGSLEVVQFLVEEKQADIRLRGEYGKNALHLAAKYGTVDVVQYLIERGGDPFETDSVDKGMPIHLAACMDRLENVEYFVETIPELMFTADEYGEFPVHIAAHRGNIEIVKYLLSKSVENLEKKTPEGHTPLISAIEGHYEKTLDMVKFLLDIGADAGVFFMGPYEIQITPIHFAVLSDLDEFVAVLLNKHPDLIHLKDGAGFTALTVAKLRKSDNCVRYMERRLATYTA